jgi:hypothetical protein
MKGIDLVRSSDFSNPSDIKNTPKLVINIMMMSNVISLSPVIIKLIITVISGVTF